MDEQRVIEQEIEAEANPHAYLLSVPVNDPRWGKVMTFWDLPSFGAKRLPINRFRKLRSKQVLLAIMEDRYCKRNIEIIADHYERIITFRYRGTVIGQFYRKIMTFLPVHADTYEGSYSTIGQRKAAKQAVQEIIRIMMGDTTAERISLAYREFLVLLFGSVARQPSDLWVSRDAYVEAMHAIEEKYRLEAGDEQFLEWRLTLLGRSPRIIDDQTKEDQR
ncbi:hypothetical protein [Paenibacillus contaminans]|uniref:Uncharacterized protein n=1 Tax=Paenibacillus contaminans TaxID=450362 RepID=A0A329MCU9_9BACL|nr:hypothetical protein [Paenibacillus contaminans]RAV17801.1 hypothetical protein DQG23_25655 [Paenibacillus contaminans]